MKSSIVIKLADWEPSKPSWFRRLLFWCKHALIFDVDATYYPSNFKFKLKDKVKIKLEPLSSIGIITRIQGPYRVYVKWESGIITLEPNNNLVRLK